MPLIFLLLRKKSAILSPVQGQPTSLPAACDHALIDELEFTQSSASLLLIAIVSPFEFFVVVSNGAEGKMKGVRCAVTVICLQAIISQILSSERTHILSK